MTPERWQRIQALFHEALELAPERRAAFLEAQCAGDAALREEVASLLSADADAPPILDTALEELACLLPDDDAPRPGPSRIGPYELVRELGRGGMGRVYLAERVDVGKRVALKVLNESLRSSTRERRFLSERRILARLEHPNIARLLDAGVTDDGLPYFAMEHVEGQPIDRYADAHRLKVRQRLELFQIVCEAVQYAHRNLLVHRDLKPSNILVTEKGEVKLLDFGIAKLLGSADDAAEAAEAPLTQPGLRAMTPEYASPEQVRGEEAVTTASDVYGLGVLLYELLTGQRPYRLQGPGALALERAIQEAQPERPSVVVARPGLAPRSLAAPDSLLKDGLPVVTPEAISRARRTPPERLRRQLRGDLDNIVLMALRKEPERRYPAAAQLAKDIGRHLTGLPVEAQQDTVAYRTGKFVRRHWRGVSVTALVVAVIAASVLAFTNRLQLERDRARLEAAKAEKVSDFLINLFDVSDPFSAASVRTDTMQVRDFLNNRAMEVATLETEPETRAQLLGVVARMYRGVGMYGNADTLSEQALRDARLAYAEPDAELAHALNERADLLRLQGAYEEADTLLREALAIRQALQEEEAAESDVTRTLNSLAELLHEKGDYGEAEAFYREALDVRRRRLPESDPKIAESLNNLALLLYDQGALDRAEPLFRTALAIYELPANGGAPQKADVLDNLGSVMQAKGDLEEAEALFGQALDLKIELLGEDHWRVADGQMKVARARQAQGDYDEAEALYQEALQRYRFQLGENHWRIASGPERPGQPPPRPRRPRAGRAALPEGPRHLREDLPRGRPPAHGDGAAGPRPRADEEGRGGGGAGADRAGPRRDRGHLRPRRLARRRGPDRARREPHRAGPVRRGRSAAPTQPRPA